MNKNKKEQRKTLPPKERFFDLLSKEIDITVNETSKIEGMPIMDCTFDKDLGLDSLSLYNICYECQVDFSITNDVPIKIEGTVRDLWDFVQENMKGD